MITQEILDNYNLFQMVMRATWKSWLICSTECIKLNSVFWIFYDYKLGNSSVLSVLTVSFILHAAILFSCWNKEEQKMYYKMNIFFSSPKLFLFFFIIATFYSLFVKFSCFKVKAMRWKIKLEEQLKDIDTFLLDRWNHSCSRSHSNYTIKMSRN